jgi:hypothetical protein
MSKVRLVWWTRYDFDRFLHVSQRSRENLGHRLCRLYDHDNPTNYFTYCFYLFCIIRLGKDTGVLCEVKHHKDRNENRGDVLSKERPDVIEAPSRTIQVLSDDK